MAGGFPEKLLYTEDHEWINVGEDGTATVGITAYAQESLGDIVFVELPEVGDTLAKGDVLGVVESVKTTSDIFMPASGEVVAVNEALVDAPETVNEDPQEGGWLIKIKLKDKAELAKLLRAEAYTRHVADQDH